jgi:hypothetical protein
VRASLRMAKERANALIQLRADDVLEPACLRVRLSVVDGESVLEEAFSQPMSAHDATRTLAAHRGELRFAVLQFDQVPFAHAAQGFCRRPLGKNGKFASGSGCLQQRLNVRRLAFFAANPYLLKKVIEPNLVIG